MFNWKGNVIFLQIKYPSGIRHFWIRINNYISWRQVSWITGMWVGSLEYEFCRNSYFGFPVLLWGEVTAASPRLNFKMQSKQQHKAFLWKKKHADIAEQDSCRQCGVADTMSQEILFCSISCNRTSEIRVFHTDFFSQ